MKIFYILLIALIVSGCSYDEGRGAVPCIDNSFDSCILMCENLYEESVIEDFVNECDNNINKALSETKEREKRVNLVGEELNIFESCFSYDYELDLFIGKNYDCIYEKCNRWAKYENVVETFCFEQCRGVTKND